VTLLLFDVGSFAGLAPLLTNAVTTARKGGTARGAHFGAAYQESDEHEPAAGE